MNAPTNYTDQIDFSTVLESYISENETIRFNAANYIENLRKKSFIDYLKCLFNAINSQESSDISKKVALVLSTKTFELISPPNQFISTFQYIEEITPGLILAFLYKSVSLFTSFPFLSGNLFSTVATIICDYNENNDIIQNLCKNLTQTTDLNFVYGALTALNDLCYQLELLPAQYNPILEIIFQYIDNNDIPEDIKILSMSIIEYLICIIDDAFKNQTMTTSILKSIETSISTASTKAISYRCLGQIIKHQFPTFTLIAEKILPIASFDLNEASTSMNEGLINSICYMITKLTLMQNDNNDIKRNQILTNTISLFFPILFNISCNNSLYPDLPEESNCSSSALNTIYRIFEVLPDESFDLISVFSEKNLLLPKNNPSLRELSCTFVSFIVSFCDITKIQQFISRFFDQQNSKCQIESLSPMFIQIISQLLDDPFPRVKNAALKLLFSIIYRDELKSIIDNSFVLYFIPKMLEIINNEPLISVSACQDLAILLDLTNIKSENSDLNLLSILSNLMNHSNNSDNLFIFSLFECINKIIEMLDLNQLQSVIPILLEIIIRSFSDPTLNYNETEFLFMFKTICQSVRHRSNQGQFDQETLFLPFFDPLFHLFYDNFKSSLNNDLLYALSYLAIMTSSHFEEYLPIYFELLCYYVSLFYETHDSDKIIDFVTSTSFLSEFFDLSAFVDTLSNLSMSLMKECVSDTFNDLNSFSNLLNLFSLFVHDYFSEVSEKVVPIIQLTSQIILKAENIEDSDIQFKFLIEASVLFTNVFEKVVKIDKNEARNLIEAAFTLSKNVINLIDVSEIDDDDDKNYLEKIIQFFSQVANIDAESFQKFLFSNENSVRFFFELLKNEKLFNTTKNFLFTIRIDFEDIIKEVKQKQQVT